MILLKNGPFRKKSHKTNFLTYFRFGQPNWKCVFSKFLVLISLKSWQNYPGTFFLFFWFSIFFFSYWPNKAQKIVMQNEKTQFFYKTLRKIKTRAKFKKMKKTFRGTIMLFKKNIKSLLLLTFLYELCWPQSVIFSQKWTLRNKPIKSKVTKFCPYIKDFSKANAFPILFFLQHGKHTHPQPYGKFYYKPFSFDAQNHILFAPKNTLFCDTRIWCAFV